MKTKTIAFACTVALAVAHLHCLGAEKSAKPASIISLSDLKNQLSQLQGRVGAVVTGLNNVKESAKDEAALQRAADQFATLFKELETQVETIRRQAVVAKARAIEHYDAWQKELTGVQNPNIREKAQERFAESKERFDKIIAAAEEAKQQFLPFVSDLKDVTIYLEADLSEKAVDSLSGTIWKLGNRSKSVIGSLADVNEQIDRTIKTLPKRA